MTTINIEELDQVIKELKKTALVLKEKTRLFPMLQKNTERILASIKMMEFNISDVRDLEKNNDQE